MQNIRISFIFLFTLIVCLPAFAQQPVIKADRQNFRIGEQTTLTISLPLPKQAKQVVFPVLMPDSIYGGIEIINASRKDTVFGSDSTMQLQQKYIITSFDSGTQYLPPLTFSYSLKDSSQYSFLSDSIPFTVTLASVDTTADIKDIKAPWKLPFNFKKYVPYIIIAIIVIVGVFLFYYFYIRRKKGTPLFRGKPVPLLPPYQEAYQKLMLIRKEKVWQQGQQKQYYSDITDTLRNYIERVYNIAAPEMTSKETIDELLKVISEHKNSVDILQSILETADLVKFAKASPPPTENEQHLESAFTYIELTKPADKEDTTDPKSNQTTVIN